MIRAAYLSLCFVLASVIGAGGAEQRLVVLPSTIVVRPDYPAQIVVLRINGEQSVDETRNAKLQLSLPGLTIDRTGRISQTLDMNPSHTTIQLQVDVDSLTSTIPLEVVPGLVPSPVFAREVAAIMGKSGCNLGTCHGNLHGKAGFRLSLRGDDPFLDFASIVRGQGGRLVDRIQASESLLLRKPLASVAHQGGARFAPDSIEANILRRWIQEGCRWNAPADLNTPDSNSTLRNEEVVQSLEVFPDRCLVASGTLQQQLAVVATFADGSRRDVTHFARFEPSLPTGVEVSVDGLVTAQEPMDVSISISYLAGRTASRLTFLPHASSVPIDSTPGSVIDQLVDRQLERLQVRPELPADDYVFVRRAHLAIAGRLPSAEEVRQYSASHHSDKRQRLVERLLHEPGYAWLWAMRWSDLLRNEQKVMSEQGAAQWHAWMAQQVSLDRPLDQFVSEMITSLGSTYEHPPASFYRTHRDPETAAESIGQVFLGVRLQCARCHNHPFDKWRQDDYYGLAAYFTTLERKQVNNEPKDKFDKHIISGDEVISLKEAKATIWHPGRSADVTPKPLNAAYERTDNSDQLAKAPLESLANWLTVDNRLFARNMANRIWYHFMGVGIVDPPDDFRDSNPPSNPELLEYLTDELIASGYSARHLARLIVTSQTFSRVAISEPHRDSPLGGARVFSGYPLRRMPAEVLLDAISTVTDVYSRDAQIRSEALAIAQVNVPTKASFLTTFGKPGRLLVCECERSSEVSLGQSLVLINGVETREKLANHHNFITRLLEGSGDTSSQIEEMYLTVLARPPRVQELAHFSNYVATASSPRPAFEDVLWALLNSKEFSLLR